MKVTDMFEFQVRSIPDSAFLSDEAVTLTYAAANSRANQIADVLRHRGCGRGTRVAILAHNRIEYVLLVLATAKIGAVFVPVNTRLAPLEWQVILEDSQAEMLVADSAFVAAMSDLRPQLSTIEHWFVFDDAPTGWESLGDLVEGRPTANPDVEVSPADALCQLYTSGTTGRPKGAVTSHEAMAWQVTQQAMLLEPVGVLTGTFLAVAPMYHMAVHFLWMTSAAWGGSVHVQQSFDSRATPAALVERKIAWVMAVPAMLAACMQDSPEMTGQFSDLKLIYYGGSTIDPSLLTQSIEFFDCQFIQVYGLTETLGMVALDPDSHLRGLRERPEMLAAAGRSFPGSQVAVMDLDGRRLPPHGVGEIYLRGPQVMTEYWNNPEATDDTIVDGWIRTGDVGHLDAEGYVYISDRIRDMIISGGENIYPREVEEALLAHPAVREVAVISVPDERWGESVKAVVAVDPAAHVTAEELTEHCRPRLARYKTPKSYDFVDALPRNGMGKILKYQLREEHWQDAGRKI